MCVGLASGADDIRSRFDFCLVHDSVARVGKRYKAITKYDIASPLLECGDE